MSFNSTAMRVEAEAALWAVEVQKADAARKEEEARKLEEQRQARDRCLCATQFNIVFKSN